MRRLTITIICLFSQLSSFAQHIQKLDLPNWVNLKDTSIVSEVDKYNLQNGYYYTQYDQVAHYSSGSSFVRYKAIVLNSSGVDEFSQINIPIDTSFQRIEFHNFQVTRKGKVFNRTETLEIKLINNENTLDQNIVSGLMMANAILDDIRKDDIVEIAYTVVGRNPLYENQYHDVFYLQGVNHIDFLNFQFIHPKGEKFYYSVDDTSALVVNSTEDNSFSTINIEGTNINPAEIEETMSLSENPYNIIEISSHNNWSSVKSWAKTLFTKESSLAIDSIYDLIVDQKKSKIENATRLLDYVQNDVRYTSINGGIGSLKPSLPSEVIKRNYGDCKDKCQLLIHLLNKLGVKYAVPVLVNSYGGKKLDTYLPGPQLFDHVIVKTKLKDEELWIDPSMYYQGGNIKHRSAYDYGFALVLDDRNGLEKMNLKNITRTEIIEKFDFSTVEGDATLEVTTHFIGKNADYIRNSLDYYSLKDLSNQFKETYSRVFLNVSIEEKLKIKDDFENNIITTVETYKIHNPWQAVEEGNLKGFLLSYEPMNLYNYVAPMSCDKKIYEIDVDNSISYFQKTSMKLPEDAIYQLNNFKTENNIYTFEKEQSIIDTENTEIIYDFKYLKDNILPEEFNTYCTDANSNSRNLLLKIVWVK